MTTTTLASTSSISLSSGLWMKELLQGKLNTIWSRDTVPHDRWEAINTALQFTKEDAFARMGRLNDKLGTATHSTEGLEPSRDNLHQIILTLEQSIPEYPKSVARHSHKESVLHEIKTEAEKHGNRLVDYAIYLEAGTNASIQVYESLAAAPLDSTLLRLLTNVLMRRSTGSLEHFRDVYQVHARLKNQNSGFPDWFIYGSTERKQRYLIEDRLWNAANDGLIPTRNELLRYEYSLEKDVDGGIPLSNHRSLEDSVSTQISVSIGKLNSLRDLILGSQAFDDKYAYRNGKYAGQYYANANQLSFTGMPLSERITWASQIFAIVGSKLANISRLTGMVKERGVEAAIYYRLADASSSAEQVPIQKILLAA